MPSYDKEKLMRLMQERRVGFLTSNDLLERQGEMRKEIARITQNIRNNAAHYGSKDYVDMLLDKPLNIAVALTRGEVESFQRQTNTRSETLEHTHLSGISFAMWGDLIQARSKLERLSNELSKHQALMNERYAILPKLKDAVIDWGFNNPDHEM